MAFDFRFWRWGRKPSVIVEEDGDKTFYRMIGRPKYNQYATEEEKIEVIFTNPAVLTVFKLQCDLFSMGNIALKKDGEQIDKHPFLDAMSEPNFFQSQRQFLWDYMFTLMTGNAYLLTDSRVLSGNNVMYWLFPDKLNFPVAVERSLDKHVMSQKNYEKMLEQKVKYTYEDGTTKDYALKEIRPFTDLTNASGNWFKGQSSIDALYKVVTNSEGSLDSKNVNLHFSGKYMVGGDKTKADNLLSDMMQLTEDEKKSIEDSATSNKPVTAVRSLVDVKRFVDNFSQLELDKAYMADYFTIGKMYGIPKDVLELYQGSTYENQEKARGSHVAYTLEPKSKDLAGGLKQWFSLEGLEIEFDWSYLPFVQVHEGEKAKTRRDNSRALETLVKLGADPNEVAPDFGFNYSFKKASGDGK